MLARTPPLNVWNAWKPHECNCHTKYWKKLETQPKKGTPFSFLIWTAPDSASFARRLSLSSQSGQDFSFEILTSASRISCCQLSFDKLKSYYPHLARVTSFKSQPHIWLSGQGMAMIGLGIDKSEQNKNSTSRYRYIQWLASRDICLTWTSIFLCGKQKEYSCQGTERPRLLKVSKVQNEYGCQYREWGWL